MGRHVRHRTVIKACPYEALFRIRGYWARVKVLVFFEVGVLLSEASTWIINITRVGEYLRHCHSDIVRLPADELEAGRRFVDQLEAIIVIVLVLFHPRALEVLCLAEEVGFASEAVGGRAHTCHQPIVQLLFDAVEHARWKDVVMEAIRIEEDYVAIAHILVQELLSIAWVISLSATLIGEVVGLLLSW